MTPARLIGRLQRLLLTLVLVGSGAYTLVYLYRWEWNRALISGVFFLASEIGLATALILRRIAATGPNGSVPERPPAGPTPLTRLRQTEVDRPDPFAWLRPNPSSVHVFVPILLGAGAVLSALAWVVERAAEATALPVADRRLALRLESIAPPADGLLAHRPRPMERWQPGRRRRSPMEVWPGLVALAIATLGVGFGIRALREKAESRPDRRPLPAATTILLNVAQRGASSGPQATVTTAEALWIACRDQAGDEDRSVTATRVRPDQVLLVISPGVGQLGTRRLTGCLSDRTLPLVEADVLTFEHIRRP